MFPFAPSSFAERRRGDWQGQLLADLRSAVRADAGWASRLAQFGTSAEANSVHVAILVEPYLRLLLDGRKTVESRFSNYRRPPYEQVRAGDVLALKQSGGPVVGVCEIAEAWFYRLTPDAVPRLQSRFAAALCAETTAFWRQAAARNYASFLRVKNVLSLRPIPCAKRDRSAWVVLRSPAAKR
jgi:hypothetical protein